MHIHRTVAVLVRYGDKYLMVRNGNNQWSIPEEHLKEFETFDVAGERIATSYLGKGLSIKHTDPFMVFTYDVELGHKHECYIFRRVADGVEIKESAQMRWLDIDEMKRTNLTNMTVHMFNRLGVV